MLIEQAIFKEKKNILTLLTAGTMIFLLMAMIVYPAQVLSASTEGLKLWFQVVLPSILPFMIVAEILLGLGVVHFLGKMLEPLMRPIFNIPGSGAFVVAMGYTSGFPVGAMLTGKLRKEKLCTQIEAERLLTFTNNASPLFLMVAIPIGMFHLPGLGLVLAAAHYGSNLCIGLLMRFYGLRDPEKKQNRSIKKIETTSAWKALIEARQRDGRSFGHLLGDAIRSSMLNLLTIGGFTVFFSVVIQILQSTGILTHITKGICFLLPVIDPTTLHSLSVGFWEITLGIKAVSQTNLAIANQIICAGVILGWSGIAIQCQVLSMIGGTDIRIIPFIVGRFLQGILSGLFLWGAIRLGKLDFIEPVWVSAQQLTLHHLSFGQVFWKASQTLLFVFVILLFFGIAFTVIRSIFLYLRSID